MINNLYDTDCGTYNPKGKIFQIDYAMEAVKYGAICVGLRSNTHAVRFNFFQLIQKVLCAIKKSSSELADYQEKIFKIDDKIGMVMSGIVADGSKLI
jgi:20S proteasome, alpha and beta subunits